MQIDSSKLEEALRRLLEVERNNLYGGKTGSASARKSELEGELDRIMENLFSSQDSQ